MAGRVAGWLGGRQAEREYFARIPVHPLARHSPFGDIFVPREYLMRPIARLLRGPGRSPPLNVASQIRRVATTPCGTDSLEFRCCRSLPSKWCAWNGETQFWIHVNFYVLSHRNRIVFNAISHFCGIPVFTWVRACVLLQTFAALVSFSTFFQFHSLTVLLLRRVNRAGVVEMRGNILLAGLF